MEEKSSYITVDFSEQINIESVSVLRGQEIGPTMSIETSTMKDFPGRRYHVSGSERKPEPSRSKVGAY